MNTIASPSQAPSDPAGPPAVPAHAHALAHIPQLDGWRGISILLVLAAHLLPLGPKSLGLNETAGPMGMSLFFTLSGFLITSFLLRRPDAKDFFIRRFFRILPLAYPYLIIMLLVFGADWQAWLANFGFAENYLGVYYTSFHNSHFWSLCVEMHFYIAVGLLVACAGRRGLFILPFACAIVTAIRVHFHAYVDVATHLRVDEILAGAWLALIYAGHWRPVRTWYLERISPWIWLPLLVLTSHPATGAAQYFRPYAATCLVGSTIFQQEGWLARQLTARWLKYVATTSYALYVVHRATTIGWLASPEGGRIFFYLVKRPISIALTFLLAHLSTFYWESRWTEIGRRLTSAKRPVPLAPGQRVAGTPAG